MNTQDFMLRVDAKRKELGISIMRLCKEVDVIRSRYYFWMDGSGGMTMDTAFKLSIHLNVPITESFDPEETPVLDDVNVHRHNQLLDRPEAAEMMVELFSQGVTVEDIAIAFQTGTKKINRILLKHRSDDDTYKRKLG